MDQIVKNPGIKPLVAQVMPWYKGVAKTFTEDKLQDFKKGIHLMQLCAVAG